MQSATAGSKEQRATDDFTQDTQIQPYGQDAKTGIARGPVQDRRLQRHDDGHETGYAEESRCRPLFSET